MSAVAAENEQGTASGVRSLLDGKHSSGDLESVRPWKSQEIIFLTQSTLARALQEHSSWTGQPLTKEILVTDLKVTLRG